MKNLVIIAFLLVGSLSYGQTYFNTIDANKEDIAVKKDTIKISEPSEKNKLYYTYKLKGLSDELVQLKLNYVKMDSINERNIQYYKNKIISDRSKKKDETYINEIDLILEKRKEQENTYELEQLSIQDNILKTKDTLYQIIKKEISNKHSSVDEIKLPFEFKPPVKGKIHITSNYGNRIDPITQKQAFHSGIDIRAKNAEIYPVMPGKVTKVDYDKKLGIYVEVTHDKEYKTLYGHLSEIMVLENALVNNDTIIGISGNTGRTNAPHLHFIIKRGNKQINPNNLFSGLL